MVQQHGLQLNWQGSGDSFNVYRGTVAGGEGTTPYATGITSTSFLDIGGMAGTTYFYKVTAVLGGIESAPSTESSGIFPTIPAAPTGLTVQSV
jgi:fibronectin type 3 domain-containing protein